MDWHKGKAKVLEGLIWLLAFFFTLGLVSLAMLAIILHKSGITKRNFLTGGTDARA